MTRAIQVNPGITRSYRLHRVDIAVDGDCGDAVVAVDTLLGPYSAPPAHRPALAIRMTRAAPGSARPGFPQPPLFQHFAVHGCRDGDNLRLTDGRSWLTISDSAIDVVVDPASLEDTHHFSAVFLNLALQLALRRHGLYYTHAASLAREDELVLLVGDANAGKTTLVLALAEQADVALLSDDASYLTGGSQICALRRPLHLDRRSLRLFPTAAARAKGPFHRLSGETWDLDPEALFKRRVIESARPNALAVLLMRPGRRGETAVVPLPDGVAFEGLLRQSGLVVLGGPSTRDHLAALISTVRRARCFELRQGADCEDAPWRAARLLRETLGWAPRPTVPSDDRPMIGL